MGKRVFSHIEGDSLLEKKIGLEDREGSSEMNLTFQIGKWIL